MSERKDSLRIHARITPEAPAKPRPEPPGRDSRGRRKLTFTDRLLRNSALACALLLAILSLGNINHPVARRASETIERALTMHIDLDDTIGQLRFVRRLVPESALVFLNIEPETELARPSDGEITHAYTPAQPWLMFSCPKDSSVHSAASGTVTAVSALSDGSTGILVDHGDGLESVYAYVREACVQPGDRVSRGEIIAHTSANLYFELRQGGAAVDPGERMGLAQ